MTTITREQFLTIAGCESSSELARKLEQIGITIADPEPPEAMVKLAEAICRDAVSYPNAPNRHVVAALAALQHVEKLVRNNSHKYTDPKTGDVYTYEATLLRAIGAGEHVAAAKDQQ